MWKYKVLISQTLLIISVLVLWELGARLGIINEFVFSSPSAILETLWGLVVNGELFMHVWVTLMEIVVAFLLGAIIGFVVSIILYLCPFLAKVVDPFLTMLNSLPKVALGPIIIIWFGANVKSIIVMALLINVIISIITMYNGFVHTDELKIKMFRSFKATKMQTLLKLVIPGSIPTILSAMKINISLTLIGVIIGEFLVSKKGIGYLILYGTQVFNLNLVFTGIFVLIILSYIIYKVVGIIEKKNSN